MGGWSTRPRLLLVQIRYGENGKIGVSIISLDGDEGGRCVSLSLKYLSDTHSDSDEQIAVGRASGCLVSKPPVKKRQWL